MLNKKLCLGAGINDIWDNTDGWAYHYRCDTALFLFSISSEYYNILFDHGISETGHKIQLVDGLIATEKMCIYYLMATVQLTDSKSFDTQMAVYTATQNTILSLSQEFQKHLSN